ncbi:hypothetical protein EGM70_12865 [Enterobacteriaceae bacterium 89]|nr:hypothetical protein [Enterobacteriaceae bacterium 89]
MRECWLFSDITWSIPIPLKDYLLIASGIGKRECISCNPIMGVKNHSFFSDKIYSLRVMTIFTPEICSLFL